MPHGLSLIERYAALLPVGPRTPRLTLGEGGTPLVRSGWLERELGIDEVWLKCEGANPTGSFKDRGMVIAVAKAVEEGSRAVLCASTGNTAASAAAYAARAGLPCTVILPAGHVALGKLVQAIAFGARIVAVRGAFDAALTVVRELVAKKRPRMFGFQAEGAAPLVKGAPVDDPQTVATAIRIGNPASWDSAIRARDESKGAIEAVSDAQIMDAYQSLARRDGVFVEPASAASVAGLRARARAGCLTGLRRVVCVLTGNGLKDPDSARALAGPLAEVDATAEAVRRVLATS